MGGEGSSNIATQHLLFPNIDEPKKCLSRIEGEELKPEKAAEIKTEFICILTNQLILNQTKVLDLHRKPFKA